MTVTTYMPRADSLADKVCQFFMRLPDEELLTREVAEKWGLETKNVGNNLARAVEAEYLALDGTVYSAGPCIALFKAALAHQPKSAGGDLEEAPEPRRHATTPRVDKRNGPFWVDIKTVPIARMCPCPRGGGRALDWTPLFDGLQVGYSFALPAAAKSAIGTAIKAYKDATGKVLACRKVNGGIRVWRVE